MNGEHIKGLILVIVFLFLLDAYQELSAFVESEVETPTGCITDTECELGELRSYNQYSVTNDRPLGRSVR